MAPIKLSEIVTFSSQDDQHRAENLLKSQSQWNRWLCAPDDRSGCIQVEIQLERAEQIGYIDIGNYGSNTVEIQVRRSYATDGGFQSLLPATMFRTVEESRYGKCKCAVKMFNKDHFIEGVKDQKWDRVKVICRELSRKVPQFGLAFISFSSTRAADKPVVDASPRNERVKVSYNKGKSPKAHSVPAWKKDGAFYRQYMETNMSGESVPSELKERILKMSSTSGDGSSDAGSIGRSAKMLLASSGSGANLREITNCQSSPVATPTRFQLSPGATPSRVQSTHATTPMGRSKQNLSQFRKKLESFIREQGHNIAYASMKALRVAFEDQLGYKMDKTLREEFKATMLKAAESAMSSTGPPATKGIERITMQNLTPEQKTPSEEKAGPIKRKIFTESGDNSTAPKTKVPKKQVDSKAPKKPTVTITPTQSQGAQQSKTQKGSGATCEKRQVKTPGGPKGKGNQKPPLQSVEVGGDLNTPERAGSLAEPTVTGKRKMSKGQKTKAAMISQKMEMVRVRTPEGLGAPSGPTKQRKTAPPKTPRGPKGKKSWTIPQQSKGQGVTSGPKTPEGLGVSSGPTNQQKTVLPKTPTGPKVKNSWKTPQQSQKLGATSDPRTPVGFGTPTGPTNGRKTVKQNGPKPIKAKKLPASAYRECPRCFGKFTAVQMNIHIANCVPDHGRIARAALGAMADSLSTSPSPGKSGQTESPESIFSSSSDDSFTSVRQTPSQTGGKMTDAKDCPSKSNQSSRTPKGGGSSKASSGSVPSILDGGFLSNEPDLVPCPICWVYFEPYSIALHASTCGVL